MEINENPDKLNSVSIIQGNKQLSEVFEKTLLEISILDSLYGSSSISEYIKDVFQTSIDELHNFGTLKTLKAIVEDNNRKRDESKQKEQQLRFWSQKDERKRSNGEQFTQEYISLEKKIQMFKQKEEEIDSIIEKCTVDGEHTAIRRETEKNYVEKWEKARIENFKFKFKSEELELQKYMSELETKMKTDQIVDEENGQFLDYIIKELEKQIEYWECKYKTDTKEMDEQLENLIITLEEKSKEIESLKKTFNERQNIIEEHVKNKLRVEEEKKLNEHIEKMATKIQAWWRGDVCQLGKDSSKNHVCKQPENCPSLQQQIRDQNYPHTCSFIKEKPIVCCSPTETIKTESVKPALRTTIAKSSYTAAEMCRQYSWLVYSNVQQPPSSGTPQSKTNCFNVMTLIASGSKAKPMEFPHMALLGYGNITDSQKSWGCGGSLISNWWILSAAHCTISSGRKVSWARLGDLNIYSEYDDASPVDYKIVEHVMHPNYNSTYVYNDIALYRLEKEVEFSAYVRPACLNTVQNLSFSIVTAAGWGRTSTNGLISPDLLKVELSLISNEHCKYSYPLDANPRINFGIMEDSMICAGDEVVGGDTCKGDSGGPLQIKHPDYICMSSLIGITSFGKYCGNKVMPGVFTRVSNYIPWIEQIVWPKS